MILQVWKESLFDQERSDGNIRKAVYIVDRMCYIVYNVNCFFIFKEVFKILGFAK